MSDQTQVRKMPERWWIDVCPECNGIVGERSQTHNETCPNRSGRVFVVRSVEVEPVVERLTPSEARALRLAAIFGTPTPTPPEVASAVRKLRQIEAPVSDQAQAESTSSQPKEDHSERHV